ncbi:MAG: hypothetical protein ACI4TW_09020 [Prevotella sp.]
MLRKLLILTGVLYTFCLPITAGKDKEIEASYIEATIRLMTSQNMFEEYNLKQMRGAYRTLTWRGLNTFAKSRGAEPSAETLNTLADSLVNIYMETRFRDDFVESMARGLKECKLKEEHVRSITDILANQSFSAVNDTLIECAFHAMKTVYIKSQTDLETSERIKIPDCPKEQKKLVEKLVRGKCNLGPIIAKIYTSNITINGATEYRAFAQDHELLRSVRNLIETEYTRAFIAAIINTGISEQGLQQLIDGYSNEGMRNTFNCLKNQSMSGSKQKTTYLQMIYNPGISLTSEWSKEMMQPFIKWMGEQQLPF